MAVSSDTGEEAAGPKPANSIARNTAMFSVVTGFSRIVGLLREIAFASYFGTSAAASAYTIAFLVPNFVAQLFANAALSAAFVPVFTDLLQQGKKREAFRLASTLFWILLIALSVVTAFFILAAGAIMPLFTGPKFGPSTVALTVGLSQVLFPVVLLLGLTGLLLGILQSYDRFTLQAISPAIWNVIIIAFLVVLHPHFHGEAGIYAFAIGVLVATGVQMLMALGALARIDFRLQMTIDWHDPRVSRVFLLMMPVTIGLGIVNLDQLINSAFGTLVSAEAPRAIENAFRVYMLPQGMFSVAVATVLFPTMSRMASRRDTASMRSTVASGMRQINLLLIPAAAFMAVLATPIVRLLFQRGEFDAQSTHLVSIALFWFAFSLPFGGLNLLLDADVLCRAAAVDPHRPGWDQHRRGHHRQPQPLQAAGDRRARNRDVGGQCGHDRAACPARANRLQRPPRRGAHDDDHCARVHGFSSARGRVLLGLVLA